MGMGSIIGGLHDAGLGGQSLLPVKRELGVDANGNTIISAHLTTQYIPTPTNSLVMLVGWQGQPANPYFFSSSAEAHGILVDLLSNCPGLPKEATVRDAPELYPGPLIYGNDGRRVYVIEFSIVKDKKSYQFSSPVGQLLWMRATYPNHPWQISFEDSGIRRNPTT